MQLKHLIADLAPVSVEGSVDREVTGIAYDSRRVTPGMVFVAVPGQNVDGHEFINQAIDRGACAVICQHGFVSQRVTRIQVADVREALARIATAFHGRPATQLKMIGVTGTNGKTTVAFMVKHILETAGIKTGLMGTVRYEIGERVIPAHRTTPEALEVQQMLAQMVRAGCTACVMEVSSHALDQKRVHGIEFDAAIFTNLTQDHLDYHGTMENYYQAKKILFDSLQTGSKRGGAVINIDDNCGQRLAGETHNVEVQLTYGLNEAAKIRASRLQLGKAVTHMHIQTPGESFSCRMPLIGRHNIYNGLAAVGAGLVLQVPVPTIRKALQTLQPVPGRLEIVAQNRPFGVYVDYAHTDDALQHVLSTLREITPGRVLLTFGCGGSRDTGKRAKMGKVAAERADYTIITSDNPRKESPALIAAQIEEGYRSVRAADCHVELDRRRAIEEIIRMARPGDSVLIAGKGHETYQEFEDTVVPFDDRVYAQETLEALDLNLASNF